MSQALLILAVAISGIGTLRGRVGLFEMGRRVIQGEHQPGHVPEATHASESVFGVEQGGTGPALDYLPDAPSLDVSGTRAVRRAIPTDLSKRVHPLSLYTAARRPSPAVAR